MGFDFPFLLLAMVLVIPVVVLLRVSDRRNRELAAALNGEAPSRTYRKGQQAFAAIFVAALVIVAARPLVAYQKSADLLFLIDVSRSMQARYSCGEPTFLDRAKSVMLRTMEALPEARIGLVAFDRFAFPVTHITTDRAYLRDVIEHGVYVGLMLEATNTEIANALGVVAGKIERLEEIYGGVRHVVLLSDGHVSGSYRRRLERPLAALRALGVRVSTVGVGNLQATPIADSVDGECVARHIEVGGDTVLIPLSADILKYIAAETGGDYFTEKETARLAATLRATFEDSAGKSVNAALPRRDVSNVFLIIATLALFGYLHTPAQRITETSPRSSG